MKKKVLLAGSQDAILDDFFLHTDSTFICMSSSDRLNDLQVHINLFEPDVFVYCMGKGKSGDADSIQLIQKLLADLETIFVLIGDKSEIEGINPTIAEQVDLSLIKPLSIRKIQTSIGNVLEDRKIAKEMKLREEMKRQEELQKEQEELEKNRKKHVLVVDDDPVMLRTIKHYLEEEYMVATAPSGKFALKFLEQKHTDIVLLDYEMPEISGPEVFQAIKENEKTKDVPVVFLTGISDSQKIKTVLAMQPQGYLLKPVDYERLHQTILSII